MTPALDPATRHLLGTGAVFEASLFHEDGRPLVEKRLLPRVRTEPLARASLAREAHILRRARHRSLPELVRVGTDERGPFLIETFVEGMSIRQIVDSWASKGGVPARLIGHVVRESFRVLAELAELTELAGLTERAEGAEGAKRAEGAERAGAPGGESKLLGFVHGDLTPDHVVLSADGDVRLLDFGASRIAGLPEELAGQDRGTLPFAAPEVARGDSPASQSSDLYSMAATALFLATREPLCDARDAAAMLAEIGTRGLRRELLSGVSALRPRERDALFAALDPTPERRAMSAREIVAAFDAG
ncbi:MAG: protein kinase [Polyangiaceae bacterium]